MSRELCECGRLVKTETVTVQTIPGSGDSKLVQFQVCRFCKADYMNDDFDLTEMLDAFEMAQDMVAIE